MGGVIVPQNQNEISKSVGKSANVTMSPRSGQASGSASIDTNHKLGKRKLQDVPPSLFGDEGPSQVKKARNHVSKTVPLSTAAGLPKKVQRPRKKPRSVIPRALRKKPNITVKSHFHSNAKSSPSPDTSTSVAYDRKRPIESSAHQCHSKDVSVAVNSRAICSVNAFSEAYTLTNLRPHKLRGISPEIPLQSDSSHSLTGYVSSDTGSNSAVCKPSRRLYDSESGQTTTDEQSESYSEDDWKPARVKKKKFVRHKTMKAAGLVIDDILKIRKQSSRTVLYDCIGSPKGKNKKGAHSPKRRLSLITRDSPKSERWAGPSARKPFALATSFLGSPGNIQTRSKRMEKVDTNLAQVTLGGSGNENHNVIRKAVLPSTDSSADEQDSGGGEMSKDSDSEKVNEATWLKKSPKRQLTVQLDKEIRLELKRNNVDDEQVQSPKPLSEQKSSEAQPVEDTRVKQRMLTQQSDEGGEMLTVDPLVFATLNSNKDKDEHSSNKQTKISSKQNMPQFSDEELEDAIVDVLGIDSVDEDNINGGARADLRENFTRVRLTDADFTTGDSLFPGLEDNNTSMSSEDETEEDSSKQQNGRLSDDDTQEPIDVLGLDDATTTSNTENTEGEGSSENDTCNAKLSNLVEKLNKPTVIKLTNADLTTEGSLLQEGGWTGDGAVGNIEDTGGSDDGDGSSGHGGSTMEDSLLQEGGWRGDGAVGDIEDTGGSDDGDGSSDHGSNTEEPGGGERLDSKPQILKSLSGKAVHDLMKAAISSGHCSERVGTVASKEGKSEKRRPRLKRAGAKKKQFVDQSSLQNVRIVLDALPVHRLPVGKAAVIVDSKKFTTKDNKKGTKKKLKAGAASRSHGAQVGGEDKVAKRTKSKKDHKPSKRKKVAKQMEDDSDDIVVKDLVEANNSEDYRVKLKLVSKQKLPEKKLSTKPTRFKPLSGPMGIASSAEDDDAATISGKRRQKLRTVEHTSKPLKVPNKRLTTKKVVQEGDAVISDSCVSKKAMEAEADIMTRLSQNHHRKTVGETSSLSTASVANPTIFQSHSLGESQNEEKYRSKTATLDAVVTSPITHSPLRSRSLEEHSYCKIAPTLPTSSVEVPQNQIQHRSKRTPSTSCTSLPSQNTQSKTVGEASSKSTGTDSTTDQPRNMDEYSNRNSATAIVHGPLQNHQSKAVQVGSKSTVAQPTTALASRKQKNRHGKTDPTPSSLSQKMQKRDTKTVGEVSSKSTAAATKATNSTTRMLQDQPRYKSAVTNAPLTAALLAPNQARSKSVVTNAPLTAALLSQNQTISKPAVTNLTSAKPLLSQNQASSKSAVVNPTSAPLLAQNLVDIHRRTLGTSTCSAVTVGKDGDSNSNRNTTENSLSVKGGASVTMTTSRLTSIAEDSTGESTLHPKKKRSTLLNRTKASSGFQLSVVEDEKVSLM